MQTLIQLADTQETIVAISTPPGIGGIAIVRLAGEKAFEIGQRVWKGRSLNSAASHTASLGYVYDSDGRLLDQCVATVFRAPASFTGQDTVEFSIHGSRYIQRELVNSLIKAGARLAHPGEFTRRAFISGKLELTQAEAIADMIASDSRAAHRLAMSQLSGNLSRTIEVLRQKLVDLLCLLELELDFSEEDVNFADRAQLKQHGNDIKNHISGLLDTYQTGSAIKNGIPVAIVGRANAGKSSLLNALLHSDRAIVSNIPGTTRDTVEETMESGDYLFRFIDTAGIRDTSDPIEQLGIQRSIDALRKALIVLIVNDASQPEEVNSAFTQQIVNEAASHQTLVHIYNKLDIASSYSLPTNAIGISAKTGQGIDNVLKFLISVIDNGNTSSQGETLLTNRRHAILLEQALKSVTSMLEAMDQGMPTDLVAQDARSVVNILSEITGQITSQDVLSTIFSRFCIGK